MVRQAKLKQYCAIQHTMSYDKNGKLHANTYNIRQNESTKGNMIYYYTIQYKTEYDNTLLDTA